MTDGKRGGAWSDAEVNLIVADYFAMLANELANVPYNKSEHRRSLLQLIDRSPASVERKHQNISAVLVRLGLPWINGYKPLPNFQDALIEAIAHYLAGKGEPVVSLASTTRARVAEPDALWIGPPPTSERMGTDTDAVRRLVRKFDPAARDARNRLLGKQGEELVFKHELWRLKSAGQDDLARKVEWTSEVHGDGAGYDIRSFDLDGSDRLIEVKTTNGAATTPFFLSENERSLSDERPDAFRLVRLYAFREKPAAFELTPPLENWVKLAATEYRASF